MLNEKIRELKRLKEERKDNIEELDLGYRFEHQLKGINVYSLDNKELTVEMEYDVFKVEEDDDEESYDWYADAKVTANVSGIDWETVIKIDGLLKRIIYDIRDTLYGIYVETLPTENDIKKVVYETVNAVLDDEIEEME